LVTVRDAELFDMPISAADLTVADSKKSAGESVLTDWPDTTERFSSSIALEKA
jgi:hypothetical protein